MAHRKRWPVLIRSVWFRSSFCVGAAVSSSETGRRDTWQSTPKKCTYDCIENASICFSNSPFLSVWLFVVSLLVKPLESTGLDSFEQHVSTIQFYPWINFYKRMKILFLLSCLSFFFTIYSFQSIISKFFILSKYKCLYFSLKRWK